MTPKDGAQQIQDAFELDSSLTTDAAGLPGPAAPTFLREMREQDDDERHRTIAPASAPTTAPTARAAQQLGRARPLPVLLLFLPPALLLFTLFVILPMGEAAWYSLYNWNGYGPPTEFIGLQEFPGAVRQCRLPHGAEEQRR